MVQLLLRGIVVIIALFVLSVAAWIGGMIIEPLYSVALASDAVQSTGFAEGLDTAMMIGLAFIIPMLGVVGIIWLHVGSLGSDLRRRRI